MLLVFSGPVLFKSLHCMVARFFMIGDQRLIVLVCYLACCFISFPCMHGSNLQGSPFRHRLHLSLHCKHDIGQAHQHDRLVLLFRLCIAIVVIESRQLIMVVAIVELPPLVITRIGTSIRLMV